MTPYFTKELLEAVNDWQVGSVGKKKKAKAIGKALKNSSVERHLLECEAPCYRRSVLQPAAVKDLFFDFCVEEETSSWTTRLSVASTFKGGPPDPPVPGVIFEHTPTPSEVVLNLEQLYEHPQFWPSVRHWEDQGSNLSGGIRRYAGLQHEVILTVEEVPHEEIHAFGSNAAFELEKGVSEDVLLIGDSPLSAEELTKAFAEAELPLKRWVYGDSVPRIYSNWIRRVLKRFDVKLP
jgi:hypothetical protein